MKERPTNEPPRIFTHGTARPTFETYKNPFEATLSDEDYAELREEIGTYYEVPREHRAFIPDEQLEKKQRTQRAFSVLILDNGERYYADGRVPHATLLRHLTSKFKLSINLEEGTGFGSVHGFMDPDGFQDAQIVQDAAKKEGRTITWFVRYTTPSPFPKAPVLPSSPIELS
jgi:hypothetical protein